MLHEVEQAGAGRRRSRVREWVVWKAYVGCPWRHG